MLVANHTLLPLLLLLCCFFFSGCAWLHPQRKGVEFKKADQAQSYDIYLLPPGEDPETCQSWLRMRNREGRYNLVFEEWVTDGPFIISPRISFEVRHKGRCCG